MTINDARTVRQQYSSEESLTVRRRVWLPTADGRDPATEALRAVESHTRLDPPHPVLEVGCGTSDFAGRLAAVPGVDLVATDQSDRMVELASARGVRARHADLMRLPFADDSFAVVAAMWMLYHLPDLHQGLAEVRRVLRPGGLFVAATNGDGHVRALREAAGGPPAHTQFSSQNGEPALRRHFDTVERQDFVTRAVFPDHAAAVAYLESWSEDIVWDLPHFDGPREYAGEVTVFTCH